MRRRRGPLPRRAATRRTDRPKGLWAKLDAARNAAKAIEKKGEHHGNGKPDESFEFGRVEDVVTEAKRVLSEVGLLVIPSAIGDEQRWRKDLGLILKVEMEFMIVDVDSGDSVTLPWIGYGQDKVGDKAANMGISGAKKYFLSSLLEMAFVDKDAEADDVAQAVELTPAQRAQVAAANERKRIAREQDRAAERPDSEPADLPAAA